MHIYIYIHIYIYKFICIAGPDPCLTANVGALSDGLIGFVNTLDFAVTLHFVATCYSKMQRIAVCC